MIGMHIIITESSVLILMISFVSMLVSFIYQLCFIVILWKGWTNRVLSYGAMNDEISLDRLKMILLFGILTTVILLISLFNEKLLVRRAIYAIMCSVAWIFQIIHNVRERNRKSTNILYFIWLSATCTFHSLYITANPLNFYEFRPDYWITFILIGILTITVMILTRSL